MGINLTVQFNNFGAMGAQLENRVSDVVRKTAFDIEANAKQAAPVDTGFLESSITTSVESSTAATVNVGAHYGIYVEMGTYKMSARPFLTPAVEMVSPAFYEAMRQLMQMGR